MSTFFAEYPVEGSSGGVTRLNGLTGALTLVAGTGITITPSGSNITIAATGSSLPPPLEALASYTPDNVGSPGTFLGNNSDNDQSRLQVVFGSTDTATGNNSASNVIISAGSTTGSSSSGVPGNLTLFGGSASGGSATGQGGSITLQGGDSGAGSTNPGGSINLSPGAGGSTGQTGNITLFTVGTINGLIQFQNGSQGTAGYVWTSTDTNGSGSWMPAGGLPAPLEALGTYNSNENGPGSFLGNNSDNDQTNLLLLLGSTDTTTINNSTSNVIIFTGDVEPSGSSGSSGNITLAPGYIVDGSGSAGSIGIDGGVVLAGSGSAGSVSITGGTAASGPGGNVQITAGPSNSGTPGNLGLNGGTSLGGTVPGGGISLVTGIGSTNGSIVFQDGSQGTAGQVWTSADTSGTGHWAAPASSGANTALSNLASVALNADLIPAAATIRNLGSASLPFSALYAAQLIDNSGNPSVNLTLRQLIDTGGLAQFSWNSSGVTIGNSSSITKGITLNVQTGTNASGILTMTNAPAGVSGNPAGYIQVTINGSTAYMPYWT